MADNYLEKKMEALQARKAKEQRAKQIAWKKRCLQEKTGGTARY